MKGILFIVTEIESANGICCKAVMQECLKENYKVFCISNKESNIFVDDSSERIQYYTVKPRFTYRISSYLKHKKGGKLDSFIFILNYIINKLKLVLAIPTWPLISPIYSYRIYKKAKEICCVEDIACIVPVFTQIDTLIASYFLKKENETIKYIPYFLDAMSGGYGPRIFSDKRIRERGLRWEEKLLSNADKVIVMESSRLHHESYSKGKPHYKKIIYLDLPLLLLGKNKATENKYLDKSKINIVYVGSLPINVRNPKYILDVFSHTNNKKFVLTFFGDINCKILNNSLSRDNRIRVKHAVDHKDAMNIIYNADILLNIGNSVPNMTPSKIFEYMSAGRPIISTMPIKNEPSAKYLTHYPMSLLLDENIFNVEEAAQLTEEFIMRFSGKICDTSFLEQHFINNTPQMVIKTIKSIID